MHEEMETGATVLVQIGEYGRRVGESHGRARLSDHEIELIRRLKEEGMSAPLIAEKMEISKRYVYKLVNYEKRASIVAQFRRVKAKAKAGQGA
jgi:predicted DNA-binding protein (UPF0251 family)